MMEDEEVLENKVVDMEAEKENSESRSYKNLVHLKLHTEITKSSSKRPEDSINPRTKRKDVGKSERSDPAPTPGPGS